MSPVNEEITSDVGDGGRDGGGSVEVGDGGRYGDDGVGGRWWYRVEGQR